MPARKRKARKRTHGVSTRDARKLNTAIRGMAREAAAMLRRIKAAKKKAR